MDIAHPRLAGRPHSLYHPVRGAPLPELNPNPFTQKFGHAQALTWALAEQHLKNLLPLSILEHLQPHFKAAHHRLEGESRTGNARSWLDKVRSAPVNQPLLPPQIDENIHREITHALLHEKQVEVRYRKKGQTELSSYRIHPLGLVQRGPVIYLYCRLFDYADARLLALHRVHSATVLAADAVYPDDFNMDDKAARGIWDFGTGEMVPIKLRFTAQAGEHLYETPLSADQVIEDAGDGYLIVTATVADTPQLKWWISGFSDQVVRLEHQESSESQEPKI